MNETDYITETLGNSIIITSVRTNERNVIDMSSPLRDGYRDGRKNNGRKNIITEKLEEYDERENNEKT